MGRSNCKKDQFPNDIACKWDFQNRSKMTLSLGDASTVLRVCMVDVVLAKEMLKEEDC